MPSSLITKNCQLMAVGLSGLNKSGESGRAYKAMTMPGWQKAYKEKSPDLMSGLFDIILFF
ncbi:hypothetical protein [Mucilaginibacter lacusdianchii]|uniref:hypothetical protein n=1 Tax=Mucilaginibacter lacusdianchii TaxID=2684211 RepID=UPI00131ACA9B|nr:hypothetical protein [Mucilaginibacter sp. JXJ CY 39]